MSVPCLDLFEDQDETYQRSILGEKPRLAVEAGIRQGWDRHLYAFGNQRADFVGMESFGASAPAPALFEHFGLTPGNVAERAAALLK